MSVRVEQSHRSKRLTKHARLFGPAPLLRQTVGLPSSFGRPFSSVAQNTGTQSMGPVSPSSPQLHELPSGANTLKSDLVQGGHLLPGSSGSGEDVDTGDVDDEVGGISPPSYELVLVVLAGGVGASAGVLLASVMSTSLALSWRFTGPARTSIHSPSRERGAIFERCMIMKLG